MKNYTAIVLVNKKHTCVVRFESDETLMADLFDEAECEFMNETDNENEEDCDDFQVLAIFEGHPYVIVEDHIGIAHKVAPNKHRVTVKA